MRTAVRKLGNSAGVVIPPALLAEIGVTAGDSIEMTSEKGRLVLTPVKRPPHAGWAEASQEIAQIGDDALVWPEFANAEDDALTW
jgi:antitoxin MazE